MRLVPFQSYLEHRNIRGPSNFSFQPCDNVPQHCSNHGYTLLTFSILDMGQYFRRVGPHHRKLECNLWPVLRWKCYADWIGRIHQLEHFNNSIGLWVWTLSARSRSRQVLELRSIKVIRFQSCRQRSVETSPFLATSILPYHGQKHAAYRHIVTLSPSNGITRGLLDTNEAPKCARDCWITSGMKRMSCWIVIGLSFERS